MDFKDHRIPNPVGAPPNDENLNIKHQNKQSVKSKKQNVSNYEDYKKIPKSEIEHTREIQIPEKENNFTSIYKKYLFYHNLPYSLYRKSIINPLWTRIVIFSLYINLMLFFNALTYTDYFLDLKISHMEENVIFEIYIRQVSYIVSDMK